MRFVAVLTLIVLAADVVAQGKLDQVRDAVDAPRTADEGRSGNDYNRDSDPEEEGWGLDTFVAIFGAPWVIPHAALDPGLKVPGKFVSYPYAAADTPHVLLDRPEHPEQGQPLFRDRRDIEWYCVRAGLEAGSDFDGVDRLGLRLFLDTESRFGIKTAWDYYSEELDCGCRDSFWIGDVTGTYRFVQNEHMQMHTGLGARFLLDRGRDRGGFNFLYGFDAFPVQPVHLFGSFEAGTLGSAGVWRCTVGAGVNWQHAELFAGYDYLNIGGVALQGPFVGLRLWF